MTVAVAVPSHAPLHVAEVADVVATSAAGSVMVTVVIAVHPLASVTISEYVPAQRPVAVDVVCPPGIHE